MELNQIPLSQDMKGRLSHNHQLLSSFCQHISFPHNCETQCIDAHLIIFENLPQTWNLSCWCLIILLVSKEANSCHIYKKLPPDSFSNAWAANNARPTWFLWSDSTLQNHFHSFTTTKEFIKWEFVCRKINNPHTLSLHSVLTGSFSYLNWHIHKADVVHVLLIKLWNPFFSQNIAGHSCNWVTAWFVGNNFIFSPRFTKVMLVICMSFVNDSQLIYFSKDAVASGGLPDYWLLATDSPSNQFHASRQVQPSCYWRAQLPASQTSREIP